ncbi:MAG: rRNA maturation RNase YbeY [Saprospiraceae bacterium]|nr:rRNA maturation RNase YbeY [Saprospiraceae bacterium]
MADNVPHPIGDKQELLNLWIHHISAANDKQIKELNYIFCSDKYLHSINLQYLQHDDFTDIITFPYHIEGQALHSDIFISIDRVSENARNFQVTFEHELLRVMAHGLLHLIGFGDKSDTDKTIMRFEEEKCISMFFDMKSYQENQH